MKCPKCGTKMKVRNYVEGLSQRYENYECPKCGTNALRKVTEEEKRGKATRAGLA